MMMDDGYIQDEEKPLHLRRIIGSNLLRALLFRFKAITLLPHLSSLSPWHPANGSGEATLPIIIQTLYAKVQDQVFILFFSRLGVWRGHGLYIEIQCEEAKTRMLQWA